MAYLGVIQILILIVVTIYVVNVNSQADGGQHTNSSETQVISNVKTGNPGAQTLNGAQPDANINIEPVKPRRRPPPRGRKARRRPRKRRPLPRNRQVNGGNSIEASGANSKREKIKSEQIVIESKAAPVKEVMKVSAIATVLDKRPTAIVKKQSIAKVLDTRQATVQTHPNVAETWRLEAVESQHAAVETRPAAVVDIKPTIEETKAAPASGDFGFGQDLFFWGETTTVAVDVNEPPPEFSVIKKTRKRVIPKVDTNNSKAYDGTPCTDTFKSHPTDKTKYIVTYTDGGFDALDCPPNLGTGLVWRQDLCACGEELVAQDPDDSCALLGFNPHLENRHKYLRKDHGVNAVKDCPATLVWSQENCLCIYDSTVKDRPIENPVTFVCKTILQMSFEGNLTNTAEGYHVQSVDLRRRGKLPRIRYRKVPGSTEKAAMIVSQPLEFLAFRGNDFQRQVTYALSFKISPRHRTRSAFMVLITDECLAGGQNRARNASIRLAFQPNTRTFQLQFRTQKAYVEQLVKGVLPDTHGWYKVVIYLEDNTLNMEVNGQLVFQQVDIPGKIPQNKCPLYIAGRGRGFDRSQDFYGYLDNVILVKDCKFHEANIKFL